MAIKMTGQTYCKCVEDYVREFICDTAADLANLPECCTKSTALVIATGDVFVVNASGEWVKFGGGTGSTWVFGDEITIPEELLGKTCQLAFVCNGNTMHSVYFYDDGSSFCFYGDGCAYEDAYYTDGDGWQYEGINTIIITEMPNDEALLAWIKANATKTIA